MPARLDGSPGVGELRRTSGEWIRRELIDTGGFRANRDADVLRCIQRYMFEYLPAALAGMNAIEIERKRIEELQLFVILKEMFFLDPGGPFRTLCNLRFEPLLPIDLARKHPVGNRSIRCRNLVDQHELRKPIAPVIEAP